MTLSNFIRSKWLIVLALLIIFSVGFAIRLYDLTDPPLDFHETRQLGSAVIARGMYYQMLDAAPEEQRDMAINLWHEAPVYEPQLLERLVATTYLIVGAEHLWISRIFTSFFWLVGAVGIFILASIMTSVGGGLVAAAIFAILPYGIIASRSFQPDPVMVTAVIFAVLALYLWSEKPTWRRAVLAGLLCGLAVLLKAVAIFPVVGAFLGLIVSSRDLKKTLLNPQTWIIGLLAVAPAMIWNTLLITERASGLFGFWVLSFRDLIFDPSFYIRWVGEINYVVGFEVFVLSLIGILLMKQGRAKGLMFGTLFGYLIYGLALPYQIMTHDYYHLMLIAIVALGISCVAALIINQLRKGQRIWQYAALLICVAAVGSLLWSARVDLAREDYRSEVAGWKNLGEELPSDGSIIALTHGYGFRLQYYGWKDIEVWPYRADMTVWELSGSDVYDFEEEFRTRTLGMDYFLITHFAELESQPQLKEYLYQNFHIHQEGDGYILFDLRESTL
ncbi:MAG: hypothetical protein GTO18_06340 [Anaerolineales bacterium]|nr:hypothetical protein [Anaerolineales bacterium]